MANPVNVLQKLQTKVFVKNNKIKARDVEEISYRKPISTRYSDDRDDDQTDVPDVHSQAADNPYTTYRTFGMPGYSPGGNKLPLESDDLDEQSSPYIMPGSPLDSARKKSDYQRANLRWHKNKELAEVKDPTQPDKDEADAPEEPKGMDARDVEAPSGTDKAVAAGAGVPDGEMGGDMGMGGGMGMGGFGMEEEPKEPKELGRIYELKKIYARLTSLESYLSDASEPDLLRLRTIVSQSIEMFEILASNFDSYKDKLDEIIIMYYKFLDVTYSTLREYYKAQSEEK